MSPKSSAAENQQRPAVSQRVIRKHQVRREGILKAAAEIFAEMGYHRTSLEEIADRLDLTRASLYHYFSSKDALLSECLEFGSQGALQALAKAEEAHLDGAAEDRLRALIRIQLEIICRDAPELSRLFLGTMDWPDSFRSHIKKLRNQHDTFFRNAIQGGVESGEFDCPNTAAVIHCMHGAMNYAPLWLKPTSRSFERDLNAVIDALLRMVRPEAGR